MGLTTAQLTNNNKFHNFKLLTLLSAIKFSGGRYKIQTTKNFGRVYFRAIFCPKCRGFNVNFTWAFHMLHINFSPRRAALRGSCDCHFRLSRDPTSLDRITFITDISVIGGFFLVRIFDRRPFLRSRIATVWTFKTAVAQERETPSR